MYRCIRSEECVYRFIVRNYVLSLPPRRVEEGRYDVSMSCTEGVTKRRYRVLCSWWPLVPDNNLLFNEVELRTYAKVVGSDRVASRRVRVRVRVRVVWGMWCEGANARTCERANVTQGVHHTRPTPVQLSIGHTPSPYRPDRDGACTDFFIFSISQCPLRLRSLIARTALSSQTGKSFSKKIRWIPPHLVSMLL